MTEAGKNSSLRDSQNDRRDRRDVQATLNYRGVDEPDRRTVTIRDARAMTDLSLDREGFILAQRASAVRNFYDAGEVRAIYYPEVAKLLIDLTGARRAQVFEHDVRCESRARDDKSVRRPVRMIHDDYTAKSSPERVRLYLPEEAEGLISKRYAIINVWRAIRGPVEATPLAVCDASSVAAKDLLPTEEGVKHEVYLLRYQAHHRWYYFSRMRPEEPLVLKCFDTAEGIVGRCTAHSAFDDPTTPENAAPRESIEARAFVFYG
ncbi:MAG TPA: CmcJ/NvfI family oxidoreductase [Candidatus Binataceae bacterium]|nr:CmcJ/NvfI family oxidoreductase [Candidatus Binataceae bacterium]